MANAGIFTKNYSAEVSQELFEKYSGGEKSFKAIDGQGYDVYAIEDGTSLAIPSPRSVDQANDWKNYPDKKPASYLIDKDGISFTLIDSKKYVNYLKEQDAEIMLAEKTGAVIAIRADEPTDFITYTSDGNAELSSHAEAGDWILTRANLDGTPYIDEHGNTNSWVMQPDFINGDKSQGVEKTADEKMAKKYDMENIGEDGFVKPKGGQVLFIRIDENIAIIPSWDTMPQTIRANGVINIQNENDMYGIAKEEFENTYAICEGTPILTENIDEKLSSMPEVSGPEEEIDAPVINNDGFSL